MQRRLQPKGPRLALLKDCVDLGLCGPPQRSAPTGWDLASAVHLLLFPQKATMCCMSRHCPSRCQGQWPKPPAKSLNGLSGLTVESWTQSVKSSQYLGRVMGEVIAKELVCSTGVLNGFMPLPRHIGPQVACPETLCPIVPD